MKPKFPRAASLLQRIRRITTRKPRAIESPLPVEVHRAMAGAFCTVVFAYTTTLPEIGRIAILLGGAALFTGVVSLWYRRARAALAGLLGGAACGLLSYPLRLSDAPDLSYPVLVCAVAGAMMGSASNSSLGDTVVWVLKFPSHVRRGALLLAGFALVVAASFDAEQTRQFVSAVTEVPRSTAILLAVAISGSVAGAVVCMTAGWGIGRLMRRAAAASPAGDGDAWAYWEAHSRW